MPESIAIFWFRRDLRLEDNTGLYYSLNSEVDVLPVFIFDTEILDSLEDKSDARVTFIYDQVTSLHQKLSELNSTLCIRIGRPLDVFKKLLEEYKVSSVYTNRDYEQYALDRDHRVEGFLRSRGINFFHFKDQVIFEKGEILTDLGEPYKVFTPYRKKWLLKLQRTKIVSFQSERALYSFTKRVNCEMPSIESIGFKRSSIQIPDCMFSQEKISNYEKLRDFPAKNGTTRIGIHLRHGTISIRSAVSSAMMLSDIWLNELIWREFYSMILAEFPHVTYRAFKPKYDRILWRNNESEFDQWCKGRTGYPIVDAGMRELNETGYMHNRVRMIVASFLTKHLLIDWRWGEAYFASKLLDFELASTNGGWQWAAGTGTDAQPYFRVFNPTIQMRRFDPELKYIRRWVKEFDTEAYPLPLVDHKMARQRAIAVYKKALS